MSTPLPFSFSSLDTFTNCPKQYHAKYVLKSVKDERSPQMIYGEDVHKSFENRFMLGTPLPEHLEMHEKKVTDLLDKGGVFECEQRVGLTKRLEACDWKHPDIFWRGIIDLKMIDRWDENKDHPIATLVDWKTGKPHKKWTQLAMFAIHTFIAHPEVSLVNAQFYWTKDGTTTKKVWGRAEQEELWGMFMGDLTQYRDAFKTDTWQERPSGLCYGWCPLKTCQHWKTKKT